MRRRAVAVLAAVFVILSVCRAASTIAGTAESASGVVQELHTALLDAMRAADSISFRERYARLAPVIRRTHDLPKIARISLGSHWRGLNRQQRVQFIDVFSRLSISIYANRFKSYGGEHFAVVAEKATRRGGRLVQTRLIKADGDVVHLDYQMRRRKRRWRIVNVIANGVSDLALKRAEYSSVVKGRGFSGLIVRLREKIAQYG